MEQARAWVASVGKLSFLDPLLVRILGEPDQELQFEHLRTLIHRDAVLAGRILRVANSAFYGHSRTIGSIDNALMVLGSAAVKGMAVAASFDVAGNSLSAGRKEFLKRVQAHSLVAAVAARLLATRCPEAGLRADDAFLLGLLHDLGWLVSLQVEQARESARELPVSFGPAEVSDTIPEHSTLTAALLESWHLPEEFIAAVQAHDAREITHSEAGAALTLQLADQAALLEGASLPECTVFEVSAAALAVFGLDPAQFPELAAQAAADAGTLAALIS